MRRRFVGALLTGVALVALAAPAWAHATLTAASVPAGTAQHLQMRVPEEHQGDRTDKIEIQMPAGFRDVACGEKAGWSCVVDTSGTQPVVTFTRADPSAQADDRYQFTVHTPAQPGTFTLPAVQSYASGTAVQWIGPQGSGEPAPVLVTTAAGAAVPAAEDEGAHHDEGHGEDAHHDEDHGQIPVGGAATGGGGAATSGIGVTAVLLVGIGCATLLAGLAAMPRRRRG
ncbi:MAG: DUF1775 domain-containing protein [Egibacteraceae bacterium]